MADYETMLVPNKVYARGAASENITRLCIGGPLDGQRRAILYGRSFQVPILPDLSLTDFLESEAPQVPYTVEMVEYVEEVFATRYSRVSVWVLKGQPVEKTLEMLVDGYLRGGKQR